MSLQLLVIVPFSFPQFFELIPHFLLENNIRFSRSKTRHSFTEISIKICFFSEVMGVDGRILSVVLTITVLEISVVPFFGWILEKVHLFIMSTWDTGTVDKFLPFYR